MKIRSIAWTHGSVPALGSALSLSLLLLLLGSPAAAQFRQYTPPGEVSGSSGSRQKQLEEEMAEARWQAGPVRIAPWFGIRQAQYVDNIFAVDSGDPEEDTSDLTVTAGLGLTAYLPLGSRTIWTAQLTPEYVWWRDQDERSQLAGRVGTGLFGDFNRLRLEILGSRTERQQRVTSEALQFGIQRQDRAEANLELRLAGGLWLFTGGSLTDFEDQTDAEDPRVTDFGRIDREEQILRAGLAYVFPNDVRIALGVENSETDLAPGARPLSSDGTSPILEIQAPGSRLDLQLRLAQRDLQPIEGSLFVPFDEPAGELTLGLRLGWRFRFELYGRSQPVLSLDESYSHFTEQRLGLSVVAPFADERLQLRLSAETGENDYSAVAGEVPERTDDVTAWGFEATLELAGPLRLTAGFQNQELDSNLPDRDREVGSILLGLALDLGSDFLWR